MTRVSTGALFEGATRALTLSIDHMMMIGRSSAEERLAWFLCMLLARSDHADAPALDLAMQRQDIADYLGLTIETVSRTFTLFRDRGFLRLPRKRRVEMFAPTPWPASPPPAGDAATSILRAPERSNSPRPRAETPRIRGIEAPILRLGGRSRRSDSRPIRGGCPTCGRAGVKCDRWSRSPTCQVGTKPYNFLRFSARFRRAQCAISGGNVREMRRWNGWTRRGGDALEGRSRGPAHRWRPSEGRDLTRCFSGSGVCRARSANHVPGHLLVFGDE